MKVKQSQIDTANLRFYAALFRAHQWETISISWGVFEQTAAIATAAGLGAFDATPL